jgi:hypothetical protein
MRALGVLATLACALGYGLVFDSARAQSPTPAHVPPMLGYTAPPGYTEQRNAGVVFLTPTTGSDQTPCIYGIAPPIAVTQTLEAAAHAALLQVVVPGWRRLDDRFESMRGIAPSGWPYATYRAAFEGDVNGQRQAVNAMALVLPAGAGRVHIVFGMGNIARCLLEDASFEQLFHSVRPPDWTPDDGRAFTATLLGPWRVTESVGLQQLGFAADGRFTRDLAVRTRLGITEQSSATVTGGRYTLNDGQLTLVPDHRPQNPDRYLARVYEVQVAGRWRRALTLVDSSATPPTVIRYFRVEDSGR